MEWYVCMSVRMYVLYCIVLEWNGMVCMYVCNGLPPSLVLVKYI